MSGELSGKVAWPPAFRLRELAPEDLLDVLARKRAKAKRGDVVAVDAEHRELKSERARTAIEDHGRYIVKLRLHMGRGGRADHAERFALGAAIGSFAASSSAWATG